jgi:hypothetical protein
MNSDTNEPWFDPITYEVFQSEFLVISRSGLQTEKRIGNAGILGHPED